MMKTREEVVRDINELVLHTVRSNPNEHGEISVVIPCPSGMHILPQDITSVRLSDFRDRVAHKFGNGCGRGMAETGIRREHRGTLHFRCGICR